MAGGRRCGGRWRVRGRCSMRVCCGCVSRRNGRCLCICMRWRCGVTIRAMYVLRCSRHRFAQLQSLAGLRGGMRICGCVSFVALRWRMRIRAMACGGCRRMHIMRCGFLCFLCALLFLCGLGRLLCMRIGRFGLRSRLHIARRLVGWLGRRGLGVRVMCVRRRCRVRSTVIIMLGVSRHQRRAGHCQQQGGNHQSCVHLSDLSVRPLPTGQWDCRQKLSVSKFTSSIACSCFIAGATLARLRNRPSSVLIGTTVIFCSLQSGE